MSVQHRFALMPFLERGPQRAMADALARMAQQSAPDTSDTSPELPLSWWREFAAICRELPSGADVLAVLGLSETDLQAFLTLGDN